MSIFKEIGKWIRGWHLERIFQKTPEGNISVVDARKKAINFITTIEDNWAVYEPVFDSIVSDEAEESADNIKSIVSKAKADLQNIETLPDAATQLEGYNFAVSPERNKFYHDLLKTVAIAGNDGKFSVLEVVTIGALIYNFYK